jgi:hypothetical protein
MLADYQAFAGRDVAAACPPLSWAGSATPPGLRCRTSPPAACPPVWERRPAPVEALRRLYTHAAPRVVGARGESA